MSRKQTNEPTLVICYAPSRHLAIASLQSFKALSQSELFKWHCARLLYNTAGKTHLEGKKKKRLETTEDFACHSLARQFSARYESR